MAKQPEMRCEKRSSSHGGRFHLRFFTGVFSRHFVSRRISYVAFYLVSPWLLASNRHLKNLKSWNKTHQVTKSTLPLRTVPQTDTKTSKNSTRDSRQKLSLHFLGINTAVTEVATRQRRKKKPDIPNEMLSHRRKKQGTARLNELWKGISPVVAGRTGNGNM